MKKVKVISQPVEEKTKYRFNEVYDNYFWRSTAIIMYQQIFDMIYE